MIAGSCYALHGFERLKKKNQLNIARNKATGLDDWEMKDSARADLLQPCEQEPSSRLFELSKQPPSSHFSWLSS